MDYKTILKEAKLAPIKDTFESYREAILVLRSKNYTWREISKFLAERGVKADHTKIYRLINRTGKSQKRKMKMIVIDENRYGDALNTISISVKQKLMLKAHYDKVNRSITYSELAQAAGYSEHMGANRQYGGLGKKLGEAVGFQFSDSISHPGDYFYSSSLGMKNDYVDKSDEFQLVMHHELAKAISKLPNSFWDN